MTSALTDTKTQSPYDQRAHHYLERGYSVIPIAPGTKRPGNWTQENGWRGMHDWERFSRELPTEIQIKHWCNWPDAGIGLLCGKLSQIVALDRDWDCPGSDALEQIIPWSSVKKKGAKGYTAFFRYNNERSCSFNINGMRVMDVLSDGRQTLMPGTRHPEGMTYVYLTEDILEDYKPEELPQLPDDFLDQVAKVLAPYQTDEDKKYQKKNIVVVEKGETINTELTIQQQYFRDINRVALDNLDAWVPNLIPTATRQGEGYRAIATWRGGKNPNVGINPDGIRDWKEGAGFTPIDLVRHTHQSTFAQAVAALRDCLPFQEPEPIVFTKQRNTTGAESIEQGRDSQDAQNNSHSGLNAPLIEFESCVVDLNEELSPDSSHPHVIEQLVPEGEVTLFAGHGAAGKSYIALLLCIIVALGLYFGHLKVQRKRVLFFSAEDDKAELQRRVAKICRSLGVKQSELIGWLCLIDASEMEPTLYRVNKRDEHLHTQVLKNLDIFVQRCDFGLVVIDNASDVFDGNEIMRAHVRGFIRTLRQRLARPNRAVILLAHVSKVAAHNKRSQNAGTEEDYSGSTAWHNSVRSRLSLDTDDKGLSTLKHLKANKGTKAEPIQFEWHSGAPTVAGTYESPGADVAQTLLKSAEKKKDEVYKDTIIEIIKDFDARGERVTTSMYGSVTVFKTLSSSPDFPKGLMRDRLDSLMRELEREKRVFRVRQRTVHRKIVECFSCSRGESESAPNAVAGAPKTITNQREGST
jgi:archaellum biogenesis ATPase FlaH